jgi:hypothetical protein
MANHLSVKPCKHVILRYSESVEGQMLPQNGKNMNCKTNNHRHILSQIYAHHIQAFVGYNIRIWAVYPCTSVYLYGTKFNLHVLLDSRMFVAVKLLCLVGG